MGPFDDRHIWVVRPTAFFPFEQLHFLNDALTHTLLPLSSPPQHLFAHFENEGFSLVFSSSFPVLPPPLPLFHPLFHFNKSFRQRLSLCTSVTKGVSHALHSFYRSLSQLRSCPPPRIVFPEPGIVFVCGGAFSLLPSFDIRRPYVRPLPVVPSFKFYLV